MHNAKALTQTLRFATHNAIHVLRETILQNCLMARRGVCMLQLFSVCIIGHIQKDRFSARAKESRENFAPGKIWHSSCLV